MRIFDAPKTFIESLAALTDHKELLAQVVGVPQNLAYMHYSYL